MCGAADGLTPDQQAELGRQLQGDPKIPDELWGMWKPAISEWSTRGRDDPGWFAVADRATVEAAQGIAYHGFKAVRVGVDPARLERSYRRVKELTEQVDVLNDCIDLGNKDYVTNGIRCFIAGIGSAGLLFWLIWRFVS
jgi:hypothetical protein